MFSFTCLINVLNMFIFLFNSPRKCTGVIDVSTLLTCKNLQALDISYTGVRREINFGEMFVIMIVVTMGPVESSKKEKLCFLFYLLHHSLVITKASSDNNVSDDDSGSDDGWIYIDGSVSDPVIVITFGCVLMVALTM